VNLLHIYSNYFDTLAHHYKSYHGTECTVSTQQSNASNHSANSVGVCRLDTLPKSCWD